MRLSCFVFLLVCRLGFAAPPENATPGDGLPKAAGALVAIGDVHGDLDTFFTLLREVDLIDAKGRWSGGARHLVQTGDLLDRGARSRGVVDLLMRLQIEAQEAGGRVVVLLGNHEVMNVVGDLRYVLKEEFAAYAGEEDDRLRKVERGKILELFRQGSPLLGSQYYRALSRQLTARNFDRAFPPGYFAHRRTFSPEGRSGKWLAGLPFAHVESRTLFVHGGLTEKYGLLSVDSLNQQCKQDLNLYLRAIAELETLGVYRRSLGSGRLRELAAAERRAGGSDPRVRRLLATIASVWKGVLYSEDGPVWNRSLALDPEARRARSVRRILRAHDVERIVIGHSQPRSLKVEARFDSRVILIDTGMNQSFYRGTPSALLLDPKGTFEVITLGGR